MTTSVQRGNLSVSADLANFVETELLAVTGLKPDDFWSGFNEAVDRCERGHRRRVELEEADHMPEPDPQDVAAPGPAK